MSMPTFPIRHTLKPSDLAGVTNGIIPSELLVDVGRRGSRMHHIAHRGWRCLMWHAERAGFRWDVSSIDPRSYAQQVLMFDGSNPAKWTSTTGRYVPEEQWRTAPTGFTSDVRSWQSKRWKRRSGTAAAAVPGTSPHGWALAVDLAEQLDDDPAAEGISERFCRWLVETIPPGQTVGIALSCGFAWSMQSEPWHLQWYVGDVVPPFVAVWERQQSQPETPVVVDPAPIDQETDMLTLDLGKPGVDTWWTRCTWTGAQLSWVQGEADLVLRRSGVRVVEVTEPELLAIIRSSETVTSSPFVPGGQAPNATLHQAWLDAASS